MKIKFFNLYGANFAHAAKTGQFAAKKGFTLIELLVVIAIISLLSSTMMASLSKARQKSRDVKRITEMKSVQKSLEMYYSDNNGYPPSTGFTWQSECNAWGGLAPNNVIPGLIPTYLDRMPADPTMNKTANTNCYAYRSNVTDYAFLDYNGGSDINYLSQASLIDPTRDGGSSACNVDGTSVYSWKISSQGGRCW